MAGEIAKLFVSIGMQAEEFKKGAEGLQKNLKDIGKGVGAAGKTMTKFVTTSIVGAATGLFAMAQKTANAGDEIQKMALRTGFSTEALSEFKHAADLSGTSIDTIETGVKRMARVLLDADKGLASAKDSIELLNLSVEDFEGLNPEEQFSKFAMAIAEIEDPSRRAALAQEIFGKAGTDLLPMLSEGADGIANMRAEAHSLGIVFSQEAADAAAKFNDDMDRLKKGFSGVFQELGTKLIPIFVDELIPAVQDKLIPLAQQFADKLQQLINWFLDLSPETQKFVGIAIALAAALGPILMIVGPLIAGIAMLISPIGLVVVAIVALIAIGVLLWKNWDTIKERAASIWGAITDTVKGAVNAVIATIETMINNTINLINKFINQINRVISGLNVVPGVSIPLVATLANVNIPKLALGGDITASGWAMVGEAGPELLHLPRGAQVQPLGGGTGGEQTIYVMLDGMTIARANAKNMPKVLRLDTGRSI